MRVTLGLSVLLFATLAWGQTLTSDPPQPSGIVGSPFTQTLTVTGGTAPYRWFLSGSLPPGLTLLSTGATVTISGIPTQGGLQTFTISATDANSLTVYQMFTVNISPVNCSFSVSPSSLEFPAAGGNGNVTVTAPAGCAWTVMGDPSWIKFSGGSSGNGNGTLNVSAGANLNVGLSGSLTIGNASVSVTQDTGIFGFVPHLAAMGGWNTTLTLVNLNTVDVSTKVNLFSSGGAPLMVPETLPQLPVSPTYLGGTPIQTVAPSASLLIEASGPSDQPFVEGSADIAATGNILGFAIFHYDPSGQEAVVPLDLHPGYNIPFDNTSGVTTGVAVENLSASPVTVPVTLVDDSGNSLGTQQSITLPAYGHTSFVLPTQFPVTANLRGAAIFGACTFAAQPFSGGYYPCTQIDTLGIRYTPPGTLTTIPQPGDSLVSGIMPHIASGNGWQTTFVLTNLSTLPNGLAQQPAQARLNFFDDNGNPLSLPLTFPQTGATMTAAGVSQSIPANGTLYVQTSGDVGTALLTGSAQLTGASGFAFRFNPNGQEAVVPMQSIGGSWMLAFDNTNDIATGVAISNGYAQAVTIPVTIRDDQGNQIRTSILSLAANGHTSFVLGQHYPATAGIRGTLEFQNNYTSRTETIGVIGIRSPPQLTFTTLPALSEAKLR